MRERKKLPLMARLASVQRVKTAAAEADLLAARQAEAEAASAEAEAKARTEAARAEWDEHLSGALFSPELGGALASRLVERDRQAADASGRSQRAASAAERRLGEWQIAVARSRAGEASLRRLRRRVRQRAEEDRLAETADRVTFDWSRR